MLGTARLLTGVLVGALVAPAPLVPSPGGTLLTRLLDESARISAADTAALSSENSEPSSPSPPSQ